MLTLALIVMLAAVVAVGIGQNQDRRRFVEVAGRFETLLKMARAEAQNENRRFRIEFGLPDEEADPDELTPVKVLWEPNHLTEPGEFASYQLSTWQTYVPDREVRVLRCRLIGASAYRVISSLAGGADEDKESLQTITFYPDGWSDSALIELAPPEYDSPFRAAVRIDGDSGSVSVLLLGETELDENHDEIEEGTYDPDAEGDE